MAGDQERVKQLQQRLSDWNPDQGHLKNWNPEKECATHPQQCCEYNDQGKLIALHLCDLGWLSRLPWELWLFSSLQVLGLSYNSLSILPAEVGTLSLYVTIFLSPLD